jgi:hypothetical protein
VVREKGTDVEEIGLFRTRVLRDGSVDIWAKGWRIESQVPALVPALLAIAFVLSPFALPVKALGAALLLASATIVFRLSRLGLRVDVAGLQIVDVRRTRRVAWARFDGFIGDRNEHEGRCMLLTTDGDRIPSPGTLDPDEMDPFWGEGDVSAVDQLNRLVARARRRFAEGAPVAERDLAVPDEGLADGAEDDGLSPGARRLRSLAR